MKRFSIVFFSILMLFGFVDTKAQAVVQNPPTPAWAYSIVSASYGTIFLNPLDYGGVFTINGRQMAAGDAIGVFFMDGTVRKCAGFMRWEGSLNTGNFMIPAWADDSYTSTLKEGFSIGEQINYVMWDNVLQVEVPVTNMVCDVSFNLGPCLSLYEADCIFAWQSITGESPLVAPVLTLPADLATSVSISPTLTWGAVSTATNYVVQVSTTNTFATNIVNDTVTTLTKAVTGLGNSTQYFWRARALRGATAGPWSTVSSFTTVAPAALAVPTLLLPANAATSVALLPTFTWDPVATATGYTIQVSASSTFATLLVDEPLTATTKTLTTPLMNSTEYFWRVKASNATVSSDWSVVRSFTTVAAPLVAPMLDMPADLATNVSITPTLSWMAVPTATAYMLEVSIDMFTTTIFSGNETGLSKALTGLAYNTPYSWRVKAVRGTDMSPWSTVRTFTTMMQPLVAPMLDMPADMATNVSITPTLSWMTVPTATAYTLEVSTSNTFATTIYSGNETGLNKALTGLAYNTPYFWRVKAVRGTEMGPWSVVRTFTTMMQPLVAPVLDMPADLATNVSLTPTLSWMAVPTATAYMLEVSTSNTFATTFFSGNVTGLNQVMASMTASTPYFWRVKAVRGTEMGPWSVVRTFTTMMPALTAPVLVAPLNNATAVDINPTLSWNAVTTATGYTLQVSTVNTFATTVFDGAVTGLSQNITGLTTNTPYYWRAKANRGTEMGPWSTVNMFTTYAVIPLLPPVLQLPANNSSNIALNPTLTWTAATNVDGYMVQVSTANDFSTFVLNTTTTALSANLTGLTNGTQYFWRVKSTRNQDLSDWSSVWSFSTVSVIPAPNQARFVSFTNVTTSSMSLAWINGTGAGRLVLAATENLSASDWTTIINALNTNPATYTATGTWASKTAVTAGGKTAYVVGKTTGTNRMLQVSGLDGSTMYYFHVVEYDYSPAIYNAAAGLLNPRYKETLQGVVAPVATPATMVSQNMFYANWTLASTNVDFFEVELNGTIYDVGSATSANGFFFPFLVDAGSTNTYRVRTVYNNTRSNWSDFKTVVVYSTTTLTGPASVCVDVPNVYTVSLTGATLVWSAQNASASTMSGNNFTATWMVPGTYEVAVAITDAAGNTGSLSKMVTVEAAPVVTCPTSFAVCINAASINLTGLQGVTPVGGYFVGDGVNQNNMFSPADAGVGTHDIAYFYVNPTTGCDNICEFEITVNALPTVTAPANMAVCADAQAITLTGGMPAGGVYSMNGTALTSFNPAMYAAGAHTIKYTVTNASGCSAFAEFTITINALPVITVPATMTVCDATAPYALTGATPAGGTYSGTGVSGNMFTPATGIGSYTITYSFTNASGCSKSATFVINVTAAPVVVVPANSGVCINAPAFALTGATPAGGVYTINNVATTMFNPATLGAGAHVVTYTVTAGSCVVAKPYTITVNPLPVITTPTIAPVCVVAPAFALTGATPAGGTYSGAGVSLGMFNPATAGVGSHIITYNFTNANGCANSATFTVLVTPATAITTNPVSMTVVAGTNAMFEVVAANATAYQWEVMVPAGTWTPISGANTATLNLNAVAINMNANRYRVVVSGCGSVTSTVAILTVNAPLVAPTVQASNIMWLNWGRTEITFSWTNGNGTNRIVVAAKGTSFPAWTPVNNTLYVANPVANASILTGQVVYNGTGNSVTVSGLDRQTAYSFHVFEYNTQSGQYLYLATAAANNPLSRSTSRKEEVFTPETKSLDAPFTLNTVAPNPVNDNINFSVEVYEAASFRLELSNMLGEVVYSDNMNLNMGTYPMNIATVSQTGSLVSGTYTLRLISNGIAQTQKVVVIK